MSEILVETGGYNLPPPLIEIGLTYPTKIGGDQLFPCPHTFWWTRLLLYIFYRVTYFHNELGITRLIYGTTPPPFYIRLYCYEPTGGSTAWTVEYVPCEIILYSLKV